MGEYRKSEHRPIQTSAVIVLSGSNRPITRPPSPPTPSATPADNTVQYREPTEAFQLAGQHSHYQRSEIYAPADCADNGKRYVPSSEDHQARERRLRGGIHVINSEALALANLTKLYETDAIAQNGFHKAIEAITRQASLNSKLVIIGVGKSGLIGKKLVATFQSLAVRAVFLHPTEALHGDLGIVGPDDTLMFITYSGSTQELFAVLPHLDESLPTILITSHTRHSTCEFIKRRPNTILVPAPVHMPEKISFGVSAPTTSTTAALAIGDALAMTAAQEMHPNIASAFAKNHPGGAIGVAAAASSSSKHLVPPKAKTLRQIAVGWENIHDASHLSPCSTAASLLRAGYASEYGWVRVGEDVASPTQMRNLSDGDMLKTLDELCGSSRRGRDAPLLVSCHDLLAMSAETTVRQARDILCGSRAGSDDEGAETPAGFDQDGESVVGGGSGGTGSSVIAVTENGRICGVLEASQVLDEED